MDPHEPDATESSTAPTACSVTLQGTLFDDLPSEDLPDGMVIEDTGYRGPVALKAAGITYRQLDYWARTGLVEPSVREASGSGTQRLYAFRDILVLKVVKKLLDAGVSLPNIRTAIATLRHRGVDDLAQLTLISDGTTVYECTSTDEMVDLLQGGQAVFAIAVGRQVRDVEGTLASLPGERAHRDAVVAALEEHPDDELAHRRKRRTSA
ncbi:MAG: regulatory protein MerR [Frankiales bacterium]|nr:regulatory protein MerR [Frankiales bacterium]